MSSKAYLPTELPVERVKSHQEATRAQQGEAKSYQGMAVEASISASTLTTSKVC